MAPFNNVGTVREGDGLHLSLFAVLLTILSVWQPRLWICSWLWKFRLQGLPTSLQSVYHNTIERGFFNAFLRFFLRLSAENAA